MKHQQQLPGLESTPIQEDPLKIEMREYLGHGKNQEHYTRTRTQQPERTTMETTKYGVCMGLTKKGLCRRHNCTIKHRNYKQPEEVINNVDTDFIVAGTGSRSIQTLNPTMKLIVKFIVLVELMRLKEKYGSRLVIMSGMAEGFDKLLALCAIELDIRLICAVPNKGYADYYWGRNSMTGQNRMDEFNAILAKAEKVVYVMEDVHNTTNLYLNGRHSNFIRNDYMVEQGNAFLVWDPSSRGTADAFASIRRVGKPYKILNPQGG